MTLCKHRSPPSDVDSSAMALWVMESLPCSYCGGLSPFAPRSSGAGATTCVFDEGLICFALSSSTSQLTAHAQFPACASVCHCRVDGYPLCTPTDPSLVYSAKLFLAIPVPTVLLQVPVLGILPFCIDMAVTKAVVAHRTPLTKRHY